MTTPDTAVTREAEPTSDPNIAPDTGAPFTTARTIRFGAGFLGFGLLWIVGLQIIAAVLLPQRLKDIGVASPESLLGTISAVTAIVSLVSNLVFGTLSDRSRSRFGRRAPWILAGAIIAGVTLAAIGFLPDPLSITVVYCLSMVGLRSLIHN